jgi:hypothetical protein
MARSARTGKRGDEPAAVPDANVNPERRDVRADTAPTHGEIALEAYALYVANGAQDGRDQEDWFEAERSLRSRRAPAVQSSDTAPEQPSHQLQERDAGGQRQPAPLAVPPEPAVFGVGS